jgi:hypothetical protein
MVLGNCMQWEFYEGVHEKKCFGMGFISAEIIDPFHANFVVSMSTNPSFGLSSANKYSGMASVQTVL